MTHKRDHRALHQPCCCRIAARASHGTMAVASSTTTQETSPFLPGFEQLRQLGCAQIAWRHGVHRDPGCGNSRARPVTIACPPKSYALPVDVAASPTLTRSSATSPIMSSWPPTRPRRPRRSVGPRPRADQLWPRSWGLVPSGQGRKGVSPCCCRRSRKSFAQ